MTKYLQNIPDDLFIKIVESSNTLAEIKEKLGIPETNHDSNPIKNKIKKLNIDAKHLNSNVKNQTNEFYEIPDDKFINIVKESFTYKEIKTKININFKENDVIKNRIAELNIDTEHLNSNYYNNPINKKNITNNEFIKIVKESFTYKEIHKKIGITALDTDCVKNKIEELKIDIAHFNQKKQNKININNQNINKTVVLQTKKYYTETEIDEFKEQLFNNILIKSDKYRNGNRIKKYLYKTRLKEEKCEECGLETTYNNKPIKFDLEHVNGDNTDNRIENLKILCRSCHSQTDTFCRTKKSLENKKNITEENLETTFEKLDINNKCVDCKDIIDDEKQRCDNCYNENILPKKYRMNKNAIWEYPENEFIKLVKENYSLKSVCDYIKNYNNTKIGKNETVKKRINYLNINISHFNYAKAMKKWMKNNIEKTNIKKLEDILIENSKYNNGQGLIKKLCEEGLKEYKCELCGISNIWNNKKLVLQLDHKNGVHTDNRIENLQILCPNCHSCTDNYCGKNVCLNNIKKGKVYSKKECDKKRYEKPKKYNCVNCDKEICKEDGLCIECHRSKIRKDAGKKIPSYSQLQEDIKSLPYTQIGKKYNVRDNTIRKWMKNYEKDIKYYN